ncbi:anti-anti-sigma factor [Streptomyces sp. 3330]|uniref:STAS domain-containing protein n=1 Tax=Streptomyces sp. 3330 TaxID=2817755 RepID=UPI00285CE3F3|nr:STAS domain-containing protein [Streptomyces sp. 3330]MDR6978944.1 anti-anti-sigma factor [Streptomyces sp. 3330]
MSGIAQAAQADRFSVAHRMVGDVRVVVVRGEIDHDVTNDLRHALLPEDDAAPPARIVVDLGGVSFMDSSGINVFVAAHQAMSGTDGWLRIAAARKPVLHVLRLVGVDSLITCHPTLEQALAA